MGWEWLKNLRVLPLCITSGRSALDFENFEISDFLKKIKICFFKTFLDLTELHQSLSASRCVMLSAAFNGAETLLYIVTREC